MTSHEDEGGALDPLLQRGLTQILKLSAQVHLLQKTLYLLEKEREGGRERAREREREREGGGGGGREGGGERDLERQRKT